MPSISPLLLRGDQAAKHEVEHGTVRRRARELAGAFKETGIEVAAGDWRDGLPLLITPITVRIRCLGRVS